MIAGLALVASAFAFEYEPLMHGPGFAAFSPFAITLAHDTTSTTDVRGTGIGIGMAMNVSVVGLIRARHEGIYVQDSVGLDLDVGGKGGTMYGGSNLWARVRFEFGVAGGYREDGLDAWLRVGAFAGMDTIRTGGLQGASEQGWRVALGGRAGIFSLELSPGLGAGDRSSMLRTFVAVSPRWALGIEGERLVNRHVTSKLATTRAQLMVRFF